MSPSSWQIDLRQWLAQQAARQNRPPRIAIVGIGNSFRSDDAAGALVARKLENRLTPHPSSLLVLDASHAPENHTAELRRFRPDAVLLIDAAEMRMTPGTICWVEMEQIDGLSATTHTMPLSMLAKYLILELDCEVNCLGIQLRSNEVGESVCQDVVRAVDAVVDGLSGILTDLTTQKPQTLN
jgi:hydrogenase 3 maturation protease